MFDNNETFAAISNDKQIQAKLNTSQNFRSMYDPMTFDSENNPPIASNSEFINNQTSRLDQTNMTYGVTNDMSHTNMLPNFKATKAGYGSVGIAEQQLNDYKNTKNALFTGNKEKMFLQSKRESRPFFEPIEGAGYVYGMPVCTEQMKEYMMPSRFKNNEKPIQEVRVTPGLNLNYYQNKTSGGYNEDYRVMPKTVDELRTTSKPKINLGETARIPNNQNPCNRPMEPNFVQYKPPTFAVLDDPVNKYSYVPAPQQSGEYHVPITSRNVTTAEYYGTQKFYADRGVPEELHGAAHSPKRETFVSNRAGGGTGNLANNNKSYVQDDEDKPKTTLREYLYSNYVGTVIQNGGGNNYVIDDEDIPRVPQREQLCDQIILNGLKAIVEQGIVYDENTMIPKTTLRQNTNIGDKRNQTPYTQEAGNSRVYDTNTPDVTRKDQLAVKDTTLHQMYNPANNKNRTYDTNTPEKTKKDMIAMRKTIQQLYNATLTRGRTYDTNTPMVTKKDQLAKKNTIGNLFNSSTGKGRVFDTNIPEVTKKEITTIVNSIQQLYNGSCLKSQVYDTNELEKTKKDLLVFANYIGQLSARVAKSQNYDTNTPDATKKDMTAFNNFVQQIQGIVGNSPVYNDDWIPQTTKNDMVAHNTYGGGALSAQSTFQQRRRADIETALFNIAKEESFVRPLPTNSGPTVGPTVAYTNYKVSKPQLDFGNRELPLPPIHTIDRFDDVLTRLGNTFPDTSDHFNTFVEENLQHNPFVNNVVHKSVPKSNL